MSNIFTNNKLTISQLNSLMAMAVQQSFNAIVVTDASLDQDGPHIVFCNPAFCTMTGYSLDELIGKSPRILQGPHTDPKVIQELRDCLEKGIFFHNMTVNYRKNKTPYYVEWNISPIKSETGEITHFVSVQRDISEKNENLKYRDLLIATINTTPDTIVITDDQDKIIFFNQAVERFSGYTLMELKNESLTKLYPNNQKLIELKKTRHQRNKPIQNDQYTDEIQEKHFLDLVTSPIKDRTGKITHYVSVGRNVNHHVELKSQLEEWANYDSLTGAFNRRFGENLLDTFQKDMFDEDNFCCVLLADIDYFKTINDTFGHALGDDVLQKVMDLLSTNLRAQDTLIRWGGDEILIILPSIKLSSALKMAERLRLVIASYDFSPIENVTLSFGVVHWKEKELKSSVLQRADQELYNSKKYGRNCIFPLHYN